MPKYHHGQKHNDLYASDEVLSKIAKAFEYPDVCAVYADLESM
jgi:hypothetical protein